MLANDVCGDCTCAGAAHAVQIWDNAIGLSQTPLPDLEKEILAAYEAISGYDPKNPANDPGCVELDVLNYWRKNGIAGNKLNAYAAIEPGNQHHFQASIYLFGCAYLGLALPLSAQMQKVWHQERGNPPDAAPGSWGGHCTIAVQYDPGGVTMVTWGQLQRCSWGWLHEYCEESYCLLDPNWRTAGGTSPGGVDWTQLTADLKVVTA